MWGITEKEMRTERHAGHLEDMRHLNLQVGEETNTRKGSKGIKRRSEMRTHQAGTSTVPAVAQR